MTRVGIIGARGRVGRAVLGRLLKESDIVPVAGGRSRPALHRALADAFGREVEAEAVDLFDAGQLARFCDRVDLVVNCAGPSGLVLDRVIRAAVKAGRPVVDPGGYDPVLNAIADITEGDMRNRPPIIVGAGLLPGLSGLYPAWVAKKEDTPPDRLDVFYAGTDVWSPASAWDIIESVGDFGAQRPPSFYNDGRLEAVPFRRAFRPMEFPAPVGAARGILIYTEELGRLARTRGIREVRCHGTNTGPWSARVLGLVRLARLYRTPRAVARSARWLARASRRDHRNGRSPCFAIDCTAAWSDGRHHHGRIIVGDTYAATAAVLVAAVRLLIDTGLRARPGARSVGLMQEMIDPDAFLDVFRSSGITLQETVS